MFLGLRRPVRLNIGLPLMCRCFEVPLKRDVRTCDEVYVLASSK